MSFIDDIKLRAKRNKKTIVLPETGDRRTLEAADKILSEDLADIVLIGNRDDIIKGAGGLDLSKAKIIDPQNAEKLETYTDLLFELRKNKGMTPEKARELLINQPLYFGVTMVKAGDADGMVAGAVYSTADVLRSALRVIRTAP